MDTLKLSPDEKIVPWTDVRECAALMNSTWKVPRWEYTPEYLSAYLHRPSAEIPYSVGVRCGEEMGGYICFLPFRISLNATPARVAYGTWWSAKQKFMFRRIGAKLVYEAVSWAQQQRMDAVISINRKDSGEEKAFSRTIAAMNLSFIPLHTFKQYAAPPRSVVNRTSAFRTHMYCERLTHTQLSQVASLVCGRSAPRGLFRHYVQDEISFVFIDRPNTRSWICGDDSGPRAVVNIMLKKYRSDALIVNAYLEHLHVERLTCEEFGWFLNKILEDDIFTGVYALIVPDTSVVPSSYLAANGLWPTATHYNLSIVPLTDRCRPAPIPSFRFDIF